MIPAQRDVAITARGVVSPWGTGAGAFAKGLHDARPALRSLSDGAGSSRPAGMVSDFEPKALLPKSRGLREFDRTSLLLAGATALALADAGRELTADDTLGMAVGSTFGTITSIMDFDQDALRVGPQYVRPLAFPNTVLNAPAGRVAAMFGIRGVNATLSTGETSGLDALIYGTEWVRAGRAACLLAGSAFGLSPALAEVFPAVLGEGAAMFLLEPADQAARLYARVAGFATAFLPRGLDGAELAAGAIRDALIAAGATPGGIDVVVAVGGEPIDHPNLRDEALDRVFEGTLPPVRTLARYIGDGLDAAGGLATAAGLLAIEEGASSVLLCAQSRSGNSAAIVLVAGRGTGWAHAPQTSS